MAGEEQRGNGSCLNSHTSSAPSSTGAGGFSAASRALAICRLASAAAAFAAAARRSASRRLASLAALAASASARRASRCSCLALSSSRAHSRAASASASAPAPPPHLRGLPRSPRAGSAALASKGQSMAVVAVAITKEMQTKGTKGMKVSLPTLKNQQVSASVSQMAKIMGPPAASANKAMARSRAV